MIGIIYKFTLICELKYQNRNPFYIGQRLERISVDHFMFNSEYWGSGAIWQRFLKALKRRYPNNWRCLIKREILFSSDKVTQQGLDAMEAYYIKREKSHYSFGIGGCNVLWGTANQWGSGSPMKDPNVAKRVTNKLKGRRGAKRSKEGKRNISIAAKNSWINADERRKKLSDLQKSRMSDPVRKEKMRKILKGRKFSEETIAKMIKNHHHLSKDKHPLWGSTFIWITNGVNNKRHNPEQEIPEGWFRGKVQKGKIYIKQ